MFRLFHSSMYSAKWVRFRYYRSPNLYQKEMSVLSWVLQLW